MPYFRAMINGENFVLSLERKATRVGFFTTRCVYAETEAEAREIAVRMVRDHPKLKGALNQSSDLPIITCEELLEVDTPEAGAEIPGFTFYPDDAGS